MLVYGYHRIVFLSREVHPMTFPLGGTTSYFSRMNIEPTSGREGSVWVEDPVSLRLNMGLNAVSYAIWFLECFRSLQCMSLSCKTQLSTGFNDLLPQSLGYMIRVFPINSWQSTPPPPGGFGHGRGHLSRWAIFYLEESTVWVCNKRWSKRWPITVQRCANAASRTGRFGPVKSVIFFGRPGTHLNICAILSKLEKHDKAAQSDWETKLTRWKTADFGSNIGKHPPFQHQFFINLTLDNWDYCFRSELLLAVTRTKTRETHQRNHLQIRDSPTYRLLHLKQMPWLPKLRRWLWDGSRVSKQKLCSYGPLNLSVIPTQGEPVAMKGSSARLASFGADRQAEKLCVSGHELSLEPIL